MPILTRIVGCKDTSTIERRITSTLSNSPAVGFAWARDLVEVKLAGLVEHRGEGLSTIAGHSDTGIVSIIAGRIAQLM